MFVSLAESRSIAAGAMDMDMDGQTDGLITWWTA